MKPYLKYHGKSTSVNYVFMAISFYRGLEEIRPLIIGNKVIMNSVAIYLFDRMIEVGFYYESKNN